MNKTNNRNNNMTEQDKIKKQKAINASILVTLGRLNVTEYERDYLERIVHSKGCHEVRIAKTTDPKSVAISILKAIGDGKVVKLTAVGDASNSLLRAQGFVQSMKCHKHDLQFLPLSEYKEDTNQITNSVDKFKIVGSVIYDRKNFELEDIPYNRDVIMTDCLNNRDLLSTEIEYYNEIGYDLTGMCPVYVEDKTSYIYLSFKKRGK
ncbi:hypothetical protein [Paraclostridium bifermentans]|uniref:hypothetical protein n=1 Tax=Paraclostridium bifermentans TaxID=1490 RepID=UPI00374E55D5